MLLAQDPRSRRQERTDLCPRSGRRLVRAERAFELRDRHAMQEREQPTLVAVGSQRARLIGHLAADDLRSQPVGERPSFEMQPGVLEAFARQTHDSRLSFLKMLDD